MERDLLTPARVTRMLEAPTVEDAVKVMAECGYPEMTCVTTEELSRALALRQQRVMKELSSCAGGKCIVDIFRLRRDYHNAGVLIKSAALDADPEALLTDGGRYDRRRLRKNFRRDELSAYSGAFRRGIFAAREILAATGDPQQADFILDRACFEELTALAQRSDSKFLRDYAALLIDAANLRSCVRAGRLGRGDDFLAQALIAGGSVSVHSLLSAHGSDRSELFLGPSLRAAAAESRDSAASLTEFERLCDNAVTEFVRKGRRIPFGAEPVLGYLHAVEGDAVTIRIIITGRMAGYDADTLRERLRECYV